MVSCSVIDADTVSAKPSWMSPLLLAPAARAGSTHWSMTEVVVQAQSGLSTPAKVTPVGRSPRGRGWVAGPAWRLSAGAQPTGRTTPHRRAALPIVTGMVTASPA